MNADSVSLAEPGLERAVRPRGTAAIYSDLLLGPSMTFVLAQAEALTRFSPVYVGSRAYGPGGLDVPSDRLIVINQNRSRFGKWREIPHKIFGYDPIFLRRIARCNPVLIHAHFGPCGILALPLAQRLGIPLIVTFHGYDATVRDQYASGQHYTFRTYMRSRQRLASKTDLFITVSEFIRGQIREQGFPEEKIVVHYIGVNTEYFRANQSVERQEIVLFVGRLTEKKGCEYLIHAMGEVEAARPGTELVVIGEGPLRSELEKLAIKRLRKFRFLGVQPPAVVREWMNRAKVFSVPSIRAHCGDGEGFGIVFAEAQAMGLPVASFASGGIPEAVEHGTTGLLAPEKAWRALAENILLLLDNDGLRKRMSEAGRARVCARFDLGKQTAKLEELYLGVLEKQAKGGTP